MDGERPSRRRVLQASAAALLGSIAGCGGQDPEGTPAGTDSQTPTAAPTPTATETPTPTETVTPTPEPALPYEATLSAEHPLVRFTMTPDLLEQPEYFAPSYSGYATYVDVIDQMAGAATDFYQREFEDHRRFFNLGPNHTRHYVGYPGDGTVEVFAGPFEQDRVVERLSERGSVDKGTRKGYRVFRRFTDRLQYPFILAVKDGVLLSLGGEPDRDEWELFELVTAAEAGEADRFLDTDEIAEMAYAPLGGANSIGVESWTPDEARELEESIRGLRMWTKGFYWEPDRNQVRLKSPMVFGEGYEVDLQLLKDDISNYGPLQPYDYQITGTDRVAYIEGTAPLDEWDNFQSGSPGEELPPEPTPTPVDAPENGRWSFETDYEAEETTVTYEAGPTIQRIELLGVALNNTRLYETQFRNQYDGAVDPGMSITVETPPSQAGEVITISWLDVEPYRVLDEYDLPAAE